MEDGDIIYESMEVLDSCQEEDSINGGYPENEADGVDPLEDLADGADECELSIDYSIEAHDREFRGQKKDKPLDILHVQATTKTELEQQVWLTYSTVLRREILYQRAEDGVDEMLMWSPTKPAWADRDRFFLFHYKRNAFQFSDLSSDLIEGLKGITVKMSVLVYSTSLVSLKDFERAKVMLGLGKRVCGMKDRAGADSNQSVLQLVNELKHRNKNKFSKPLDASFTLRANHIQGSAAHLRGDLLDGPPPDHLDKLFIAVDDSGAQVLLEDSFEGATIAEAVNESVEIELKEIYDAFKKVESSVAELRQKIDQLKTCINGRKSLISAFKNSLKVTEREDSKLIAERIVDIPDLDHE